MDPSDVAHVIVLGRGVVGCQLEKSNRFVVPPERFVVQASIELGIEIGGGTGFFSSSQHVFGCDCAGKQLLYLRHGNSRVARDRYQTLARLSDRTPGPTNGAQKMPSRIFDILRVDGLVQLELARALFVFTGVVAGNAALPMLGRPIRLKLDLSIEIGDRVGDSTFSKMLFTPRMQNAGCECANTLPHRFIELVGFDQGLDPLPGGVDIACPQLFIRCGILFCGILCESR
jgi:hypothetical protein